jgi:hypothetical protein
MNFEKALKELKDGYPITNKNWNGKSMYLRLQSPTYLSKMTLPYIFMKNADGDLVPWTPSNQDLFSEGWKVIS